MFMERRLSSGPDPLTGHFATERPALEAELLAARALLELFLQFAGKFAPGRQQRMVAGDGVNVRPRHGEVGEDTISGRVMPLLFQNHLRAGDGNQLAERVQALLDQ